MKNILTLTFIFFSFQGYSQTTTINRQTVYLAATVDTLIARQTRAFSLQISLLSSRLFAEENKSVSTQFAINQQASTLAKIKEIVIDTTSGLILSVGVLADTLRNQIILK